MQSAPLGVDLREKQREIKKGTNVANKFYLPLLLLLVLCHAFIFIFSYFFQLSAISFPPKQLLNRSFMLYHTWYWDGAKHTQSVQLKSLPQTFTDF